MAQQTDIRIIGIIEADIEASHKGGSLLEIPFQLSDDPDTLWAELFIQNWNRPSSFTSTHRPGIARIERDRVILDGTTVEEVARVHGDTLKQVTETTNRQYMEEMRKQREQNERDAERRQSEQTALEAERKRARGISFE